MFIKKAINHINWRIRQFINVFSKQIFYSFFLKKQVMQGPFKGLLYLNNSTGSVLLPKLIGTYEQELHEIIYHLPFNSYDVVIDIGAAEGYYAVGIAKYYHKNIIAFEATQKGRKRLRRLAEINSVKNRIQIEGYCNEKELQEIIKANQSILIIMDVEGFEETLLDPEKIQEFDKCDILVEVHPDKNNKLPEVLMNRFGNTHKIALISKQQRDPENLKISSKYLRNKKQILLNEYRGNEIWMFMTSRGKN